jgi:hypothetical protein
LGSAGAGDSERLGGEGKDCVKLFLLPIMLSTAVEAVSLFFLGCVMNCIAPISCDAIVVKDNYINRMENY